jgi:hypothetical protein
LYIRLEFLRMNSREAKWHSLFPAFTREF